MMGFKKKIPLDSNRFDSNPPPPTLIICPGFEHGPNSCIHTYFHSAGLPPSPEDVPGGSPREAVRPHRGQTQLPRGSSQAGGGRPRSEAARRVPEVRLFGVGCLRGRTGQAKAEKFFLKTFFSRTKHPSQLMYI